MPKSIFCVGVELASSEAVTEAFASKTSLLDWDIVLFKPDIEGLVDSYSSYKGRASLDDRKSFNLKEACEHWRREIKQAFEAGKTIFVFLPSVHEVYIDTGERSYSGTGRSQKVTHLMALYSNYNAMPLALEPVNATGTNIKLTQKGSELLSQYWREFASVSEFKVLLQGKLKDACLVTKMGTSRSAQLSGMRIRLG